MISSMDLAEEFLAKVVKLLGKLLHSLLDIVGGLILIPVSTGYVQRSWQWVESIVSHEHLVGDGGHEHAAWTASGKDQSIHLPTVFGDVLALKRSKGVIDVVIIDGNGKNEVVCPFTKSLHLF